MLREVSANRLAETSHLTKDRAFALANRPDG